MGSNWEDGACRSCLCLPPDDTDGTPSSQCADVDCFAAPTTDQEKYVIENRFKMFHFRNIDFP